MKKLIFLLLAIPVLAFSQPTTQTDVNGLYTIGSSSLGGTSDAVVIGLFNDPAARYADTDVQVGDIVFDAECNRWEVMVINSAGGGVMNIDVRDINSTGLAPAFGQGVIIRETTNFNYPLFVAENSTNISATLQACMETHLSLLLDQVPTGGNTSVLTDNADATYTHDDGTGNTVVIDTRAGSNELSTPVDVDGDATNETNVQEAIEDIAAALHDPVTVTDGQTVDFTLTGQDITAEIDGSGAAATGTVPVSDGAGNISWNIVGKLLVYDADPTAGVAMVKADGLGITFSKVGGVGTFVIPANTEIVSARIAGSNLDLGGGNDFQVVFDYAGTAYNNALTDYFPPMIQVLNASAQALGGPSGTFPFVQDEGGDPQIQFINVTGGDVTARVINLNVFPDWNIMISL